MRDYADFLIVNDVTIFRKQGIGRISLLFWNFKPCRKISNGSRAVSRKLAMRGPHARAPPTVTNSAPAEFGSGAQIDFVAGEKIRRRLAILEGRNEPHGNVRRSRELEARRIQELASLAALLPGHFAAFLAERGPSPFLAVNHRPARELSLGRYRGIQYPVAPTLAEQGIDNPRMRKARKSTAEIMALGAGGEGESPSTLLAARIQPQATRRDR